MSKYPKPSLAEFVSVIMGKPLTGSQVKCCEAYERNPASVRIVNSDYIDRTPQAPGRSHNYVIIDDLMDDFGRGLPELPPRSTEEILSEESPFWRWMQQETRGTAQKKMDDRFGDAPRPEFVNVLGGKRPQKI